MTPPVKRQYCGAISRRKGTPCKLPAGHGTNHVGFSNCRLHGGNAPGQRVSAERASAIEFAKDALGAEVASDPLDALLQAVRLSCGATRYHRQRIGTMEHPTREDEQALEAALLAQAKIASTAVNAGVAERLVVLAERQADLISLAFEEATATLKLTAPQRSVLVRDFGAALTRLEGDAYDVVEGNGREIAA